MYLNNWKNKQDVKEDFFDLKYYPVEKNLKDAEEAFKDIVILFAAYSYEDYNGEAFVLFERDEKLYEVIGTHCSCYGLEGQWIPEETTKENILYRIKEGTQYSFSEPLSKFLNTIDG